VFYSSVGARADAAINRWLLQQEQKERDEEEDGDQDGNEV
jgi:hypothetical protein